jgi:replicative DNA helicase
MANCLEYLYPAQCGDYLVSVRLIDEKLELLAIKNLCSDSLVSSYLLSSLKEEHFAYSAAKELYRRVMKLSRAKGKPPEYDELLSDPAIDKNARKALGKFEGDMMPKKAKAKSVLARLEEYRKLRGLYKSTKEMYEEFTQKDKVDIEELLARATDSITKIRIATNKQKIYHMGKGGNMDRLVEDILIGEKAMFVPTGFEAWDSVNGGIPYGEYFVVCASTGGGKSVMATTLLYNQADRGYRGCLVPLEMTEEQTMVRVLSALSGIEATRIAQKKLTPNEQKKVWKLYKKINGQMFEREGTFSIFAPQIDMSCEEILFTLKPYEYDNIAIDYISLLKDVGADDNSVKQLGNVARYSKVYATQSKTIITMCAQLSDEGKVKYSRAISENAGLSWLWTYTDENRESGIIDVRTGKSRNLVPLNFSLGHNYATMRIYDVQGEDAAPKTEQGLKRKAKQDRIADEISLPDD